MARLIQLNGVAVLVYCCSSSIVDMMAKVWGVLLCLVAFTGIGVSLVPFCVVFMALWQLLVSLSGSRRYGLVWGSLTGPQLTHQTGNPVYGVI